MKNDAFEPYPLHVGWLDTTVALHPKMLEKLAVLVDDSGLTLDATVNTLLRVIVDAGDGGDLAYLHQLYSAADAKFSAS